jgi:Flp pilus assembly protein TadG
MARTVIPSAWHDRRGTAAIEFALIASFMLVFLAVILEIITMVSAARDTNRVATQVAIAIATSCDDEACVKSMAQVFSDRRVNFLVPVRDLVVSIREVIREKDAIQAANGGDALADDVVAAALEVLSDGDTGVVAVVSGTSIHLLASFLPLATTDGTMRAISIAVRKAGVPVV